MRKRNLLYTTLAIIALAVAHILPQAQAQEKKKEPPPQVLFKNVNVFNGTEDKLYEGLNVLVTGNRIEKIGKDVSGRSNATVIDGSGKTLMPGLIDAHTHLYMNVDGGVPGVERATWEEIGTRAAHMGMEYLFNGFTSVREMGGGGSGLKKTIDAGLLAGPRIYPAGAYLSQTSGHGDFRLGPQRNRNLTPYTDNNGERLGMTITVDGRDQVIAAVRQNFSQGASQIKIMAGGGVSSVLDPHPGKLGVIEKGAYADILVVDGNPLEDISVIGGNSKWYDADPRGPNIPSIRIIMKDGRVYKNTLTDWRPEYLRRPDPEKLRTSETY